MKLSTLAEFDVGDLAIPVLHWRKKDPLGWVGEGSIAHIAAHLVGGLAVWGVTLILWHVAVAGLLLLVGQPDRIARAWFPWLAVAYVVVFQTCWEFIQQETDNRYPLWSMIWDVASAVAAASVAALVFGVFHR